MAIYSYGQLKQFLRQAGWPEALVPLMAAVGMAESSGNSSAANTKGENSWGLWQVNRDAHPQWSAAQLQDPLFNARAAYEIYKKEGIRAWGSFTDGRWRQYQNVSDDYRIAGSLGGSTGGASYAGGILGTVGPGGGQPRSRFRDSSKPLSETVRMYVVLIVGGLLLIVGVMMISKGGFLKV